MGVDTECHSLRIISEVLYNLQCNRRTFYWNGSVFSGQTVGTIRCWPFDMRPASMCLDMLRNGMLLYGLQLQYYGYEMWHLLLRSTQLFHHQWMLSLSRKYIAVIVLLIYVLRPMMQKQLNPIGEGLSNKSDCVFKNELFKWVKINLYFPIN